MKAGLYQIRDVVIERDIAFKEARRQDCLVQRKLSKSLGHSSRCLYTLLLFYLYGTVRDMEVHVGKCISGKGGRNVAVHATQCRRQRVGSGQGHRHRPSSAWTRSASGRSPPFS